MAKQCLESNNFFLLTSTRIKAFFLRMGVCACIYGWVYAYTCAFVVGWHRGEGDPPLLCGVRKSYEQISPRIRHLELAWLFGRKSTLGES